MNTEKSREEGTDRSPAPAVDRPWSRAAADVLEELDVSPERGLADSEVGKRRKKYGRNRLRRSRRRSAWSILADQFKNTIILLLTAVTVISLTFWEVIEGIAIGVVIAINVLIGFSMEPKATCSMKTLRELGRVERIPKQGETPCRWKNLIPITSTWKGCETFSKKSVSPA